jgi:hypothetical protein
MNRSPDCLRSAHYTDAINNMGQAENSVSNEMSRTSALLAIGDALLAVVAALQPCACPTCH